MTRNPQATNAYVKAVRQMQRRGKDIGKLTAIVELLLNDQTLPTSARPHKLVGDFKGLWECHIEGDWLLVYDIEGEDVLKLIDTGTHSDLFG